jgi:uncharacterized protein (TIGR02453 family)
MGFDGFPASAFTWFGGLERDNTREYFAATRETYERDVRGQLEALFEVLQGELGGHWKVFRQQRDLRFTPDKRPYKDRTYGVLSGGARPGRGFFAAVAASGLHAASGGYQLDRGQLERFRAAVVDDGAGPALERIVADLDAGGFELWGEQLKTAPRGFDRDHPRIGLLRRKALTMAAHLSPDPQAGIPSAAALEHVRGTWAAAEPLNAWLDEHVGAPADVSASGGGG